MSSQDVSLDSPRMVTRSASRLMSPGLPPTPGTPKFAAPPSPPLSHPRRHSRSRSRSRSATPVVGETSSGLGLGTSSAAVSSPAARRGSGSASKPRSRLRIEVEEQADEQSGREIQDGTPVAAQTSQQSDERRSMTPTGKGKGREVIDLSMSSHESSLEPVVEVLNLDNSPEVEEALASTAAAVVAAADADAQEMEPELVAAPEEEAASSLVEEAEVVASQHQVSSLEGEEEESEDSSSEEGDSDDEEDSDDEDDEERTPEEEEAFLDSLLASAYSAAEKKEAERAAAKASEEMVLTMDSVKEAPLPTLSAPALPRSQYSNVPSALASSSSSSRHQPHASTSTSHLPALELDDTVISAPLSKKAAKAARKATASQDWHTLPTIPDDRRKEMTREYHALKLRNSLDPKRFYKGQGSSKIVPESFAIGRLIEPRKVMANTTLVKEERVGSIVADLVKDEEAKRYAKRKFSSLQDGREKNGRGQGWKKRTNKF